MVELHGSAGASTLAVDAAPLVTPAQAVDDRIMRARDHVSGCVVLALVTSTTISADLIDRAIEHARAP